MVFDPLTGNISGAATAQSAQNTYTVSAKNALGQVPFTFSLKVSNPEDPILISYSQANFIFKTGSAVTLAPRVQAGIPVKYSISPALPSGLIFPPMHMTPANSPCRILST